MLESVDWLISNVWAVVCLAAYLQKPIMLLRFILLTYNAFNKCILVA